MVQIAVRPSPSVPTNWSPRFRPFPSISYPECKWNTDLKPDARHIGLEIFFVFYS